MFRQPGQVRTRRSGLGGRSAEEVGSRWLIWAWSHTSRRSDSELPHRAGSYRQGLETARWEEGREQLTRAQRPQTPRTASRYSIPASTLRKSNSSEGGTIFLITLLITLYTSVRSKGAPNSCWRWRGCKRRQVSGRRRQAAARSCRGWRGRTLRRTYVCNTSALAG